MKEARIEWMKSAKRQGTTRVGTGNIYSHCKKWSRWQFGEEMAQTTLDKASRAIYIGWLKCQVEVLTFPIAKIAATTVTTMVKIQLEAGHNTTSCRKGQLQRSHSPPCEQSSQPEFSPGALTGWPHRCVEGAALDRWPAACTSVQSVGTRGVC